MKLFVQEMLKISSACKKTTSSLNFKCISSFTRVSMSIHWTPDFNLYELWNRSTQFLHRLSFDWKNPKKSMLWRIKIIIGMNAGRITLYRHHHCALTEMIKNYLWITSDNWFSMYILLWLWTGRQLKHLCYKNRKQ